MKRALVGLTVALAGCARAFHPAPLPPLPFPADSLRSEVVSDGVVHRYIYSSKGPWAVHVLDVDLTRCNTPIAVKGADSVTGRIRTSVLFENVAKREKVLGGVNADFFSLANGTPVGLLVVDGRMMTPPATQPAFAVDSSGAVHFERFRLSPSGVQPFHPWQAVGGRPYLIRDSVISGDVDTVGEASFIGRNPRTAAGIARGGRHLWLAVVDGRQKPYSDGMSLRELADLMLALGARDAINLDGGGSSTFVYADPAAAGTLRIANRPSDKEGERPVGDALAIVHRCVSHVTKP